MTLRRLSVSALLLIAIVTLATPALAAPAKADVLGSTTFLTDAPTTASKTPNDPQAIAGGFSFIHFYGGTYFGAYGTFAQRVTGGEHPLAVVGQVSFHHNGDFEETPITFLGGAQMTIMHDENMCVSGRGMIGFSHWGGVSNDLNFQFTGVFDIHMKQMKGMSVEIEAGLLLNRDDEGFTEKGFIMNIGIMKAFGGK